jgi:hypothetical protein
MHKLKWIKLIDVDTDGLPTGCVKDNFGSTWMLRHALSDCVKADSGRRACNDSGCSAQALLDDGCVHFLIDRPWQHSNHWRTVCIKGDPDFLFVFCWHFASISNYFRVIHDFLLAFYMSHVTETLDDVTDRKWRHQPICWPWFPISVQYMFCVYCVPFTSYMRFMSGQ